MALTQYLSSLNPAAFISSTPGIIAQGFIWGIMALGVYITFRLLDYADLTVDGSLATGGAITVVLILGGTPAPLAMVMAVLAGALAGTVTGLLHTLLGIPSILSGILTQISLWSVNLLILGGSTKTLNVDRYPLLISLRNIPNAILITLIISTVLVCILYWYFGTEQGSALRATGSNPNMARAQGINIDAMKVITLAISNGLVALSGSLLSQYQGSADIKMGQGAIVIGLASVIIGEVLGDAFFQKGMSFILKLCFVVLGGIVYYLVVSLSMWLGISPDLLKLMTATIVTLFLAIPYLRAKSKNSFALAGKRSAGKNA